jgi:uncharacterized protein
MQSLDLRCPKCRAPMAVLERNEVTLERCGECGGIFLDRGELERLIDKEGSYYASDRPTDTMRGYPERDEREDRRYDDDDDDDPSYGGRRRRRRRGFLGDLFDFGD